MLIKQALFRYEAAGARTAPSREERLACRNRRHYSYDWGYQNVPSLDGDRPARALRLHRGSGHLQPRTQPLGDNTGNRASIELSFEMNSSIMVTLSVAGPFSVVILTTMPNDFAVRNFVDLYEDALKDAGVIIEKIEMKNADELLAGFQRAGELSCSAVLLVTHGDEAGQPIFEDPAFEVLPPEVRASQKRGFFNWATMTQWFRSTFDNRILMLAVCNAGAGNYTHALLHSGMALHVLTAIEGKTIAPPDGPKAFVHFTRQLLKSGRKTITPGHVELAMNSVEMNFPKTLDLWPYRGGPTPQKYTPSFRK